MSESDAITTSVEHRDDITLLTVGEVVDLATAPVLEEAIDGLLADQPKALIVDLSGVTFLASVGLRLLVSTHEKVGESGAIRRGGKRSDHQSADPVDEVGRSFRDVSHA